ncbi:32 kDa apolipoprotein [Operophtera brumata]|uniref:32 kDa apolipoprotein n=1 Tax=Operophtera brumata TaxID=104452 RepID=A0A0L7LHU6_OPEBR|nr:32 kDa apolipoprotein [Operophtera brumata]
MVKYSSLPLPYESEFSILDTDYDNYAVMWSCSGIGPVHTQNTWLLSRDRLPSLSIMQGAYNVLDKFKISRTFFVKTNQADCTILPDPAASPVERAGDDDVEESKSEIVVEKVEVVEKNVEAVVKPVVKPEVPQERYANPVPEEKKPMMVPELIMSESDKKDEKMDKPMEPMKEFPEKIKEFPEKIKEPEKQPK